MSDPADGEASDDESDGASDEDVRAAMSRVADGEPPRRPPGEEVSADPQDGIPDGYDSVARATGPDEPRDAGGVDAAVGSGTDGPPDRSAGNGPSLREADLSAPASAAEGDHTLLEEHERQHEPAWKSTARTGAFWGGATLASVALTTTAFVSLVRSGLSQGVAFFAATVAFAIVVGFVFLSLKRG